MGNKNKYEKIEVPKARPVKLVFPGKGEMRGMSRPKRRKYLNRPCPCDSGKLYKNCCYENTKQK